MKNTFIVLLVFLANLELQASERLKNIILNAPSDNYVIQVASVPENVDLQKVVTEKGLSKRLVAIKTVVKNENRWVLLEGIYRNKDEANYASKKLQASNSKLNPWVRSISSLKQVLAIHSL